MKRITLAAALLTAACTPAQLEQANAYQQQIRMACAVAMALAPYPEVVGACRTEAAIAAVALDPSTLDWLNGIIVRARS